jgi:hypothetical protein
LQISKTTLEILSSFSKVNQNIVIQEGTKIETMSPSKDLIASYESADTFDSQVSIYNLNEFLGVLSAFDKPELDISDKLVVISQGKQKVSYTFADASLLITPPVKGIKFPISDITFTLTDVVFSKLQKMSAILTAGDFSVIGDGKTIILRVHDLKNPTCNVFEIDTEVETSESFQVNYKMEKMKLLSGSYTVDVSAKKISRFTHTSIELVYYVAIESTSDMSAFIEVNNAP